MSPVLIAVIYDYQFTFDKEAKGTSIVLWVHNITTGENVKDIKASPLKSPLDQTARNCYLGPILVHS